jgi:hypothetical protein
MYSDGGAQANGAFKSLHKILVHLQDEGTLLPKL